MIQANLIPIARRLERQRQHRIRRWVSICTVYSILLVAAYGTLQAMWGHGDQLIEQDVSKLTEELAQTDKELKAVAPKLQEARLTLAASMAVGSQPDWSILLALLAREMREHDEATATLRRALVDADQLSLADSIALKQAIETGLADENKLIVLSHCELTPVSDAASAVPAVGAPNDSVAPAVTHSRYTLALSGMGRSQAAISQYVLRLEKTGLFDRVTLIESKIAPFGGGEAVSFRIGCTLGETGK